MSIQIMRPHFQIKNEGTQLGDWILAESRRRHLLGPSDYCRTYLLSYPRSGNHAVRYVLEHLSRRPTLGADDHESRMRPQGLHDLPIFLRPGLFMDSSLPQGIKQLSTLRPIAIKRHNVKPIDGVERLIFIERDPIEAILSQRGKAAADQRTDLEPELEQWMTLHDYYERFPAQHKLRISFTDILAGEVQWVRTLVRFLGLKVSNQSVMAAQNLIPMARKSLKRKPKTSSNTTYRERFPDLAARLDTAVQAWKQ